MAEAPQYVDESKLLKQEPDGTYRATVCVRTETEAALKSVVLKLGELAFTTDTHAIYGGDDETAGGFTLGEGNSNSSYTVMPLDTPAASGAALVAAHEVVKQLLPGGQEIGENFKADLIIRSGVYDLAAAELSLILDTPHINLIGVGQVVIKTNSDYKVVHAADNVSLRNIGFAHDVSGQEYGAIHFDSAETSGIRHEDLRFVLSAAGYATTMAESMTSFAGTYIRGWTNGFGLYGTRYELSSGCSATFEECYVMGNLNVTFVGSFGGTGSASTPNIFTGYLLRCYVHASHMGIVNRGRIEYCRIRNGVAGLPAVYAGTNGRFFHNIFYQSNTGSPYSIGYYETCNISAAFNVLRGNGIEAGITNLIDTPYNVVDNDWSVS